MNFIKFLCLAAILPLACVASAATITVEDGGTTTWDTMDFKTGAPAAFTTYQNAGDGAENDPWQTGQSFTAEHDGTVTSISALAVRLWGGTYYMDVYESFAGDGSTYTATPDKFRPGNLDWLVPVITNVSLAVDGTNDINIGGVMTVNLDAGEQFPITTGAAYVVIFRQANADPGEVRYGNMGYTDVYAGGVWGYSNQNTVSES